MLTDYLLTGVCAWCGFRLCFAPPPDRRLWSYGYFCLAGAALAGGTFHGFREFLSPAVLASMWSVTLTAIGVGVGFMVSGVLVQRVGARAGGLRIALVLTLVGLLMLALRVGVHPAFNQNDVYHMVQLAALVILYRSLRPDARFPFVRKVSPP